MKCFCAVAAVLVLSSIAAAQPAWTLTSADFQGKQVDLVGIDDSGLKVADKVGAAPRPVSWDQLLLIERSLPSRGGGKFTLRLSGGDQLRGEPVKIEGETLKWSSPSLGAVTFPLRQVASIARSSPTASPAAQGDDAKRTEDSVQLANGDTVSGILSDVSSAGATIQSNGNPATVPLDSITAIYFAATGAPPADSGGRAFRVKLIDDSIFTAKDLRMSDGKMQLTLADGSKRPIGMDAIVGIEQVNGPVSWLSSRTPSENVQTPFLGTTRPARMDRTVTGEPIRFADRTYSRGIGVQPYSRITWPLDGRYQTFRTQYAIDGNRPYANVTVRVLLDGKPMHERADFTAGELSPIVQVPLGSAKQITLEVDYGQNYAVQDRLNWIEPALVKGSATK